MEILCNLEASIELKQGKKSWTLEITIDPYDVLYLSLVSPNRVDVHCGCLEIVLDIVRKFDYVENFWDMYFTISDNDDRSNVFYIFRLLIDTFSVKDNMLKLIEQATEFFWKPE